MKHTPPGDRTTARRNLLAGLLAGVIVATVAGAWATPTTFTKMVKGQPATAADVNKAHQDLANAIDTLQKTVTAQAAEIAKLKTAPDCPPGYKKDTTAPSSITVCKRGKDEMVKVGSYWVDRYEVSLVDASRWNGGDCNGSGAQYGAGQSYPIGFHDTGYWSTKVYACSISGATPSDQMTWLQAQQACLLAGKRLCSNSQWQGAVSGTYDPGSWPDTTINPCTGTSPAGSCNTCSSGVRNCGNAGKPGGGANSCISVWGAEDMIGNLAEWVDIGWGQTGKVDTNLGTGYSVAPWPSGFGDSKDRTWNINGTANTGTANMSGSPSVALRGGMNNYGEMAGAFAFDRGSAPSRSCKGCGARCCRD